MRIIDRKISDGPAVAEGDVVTLLYKCALSEEDLEAGNIIDSNYSPDNPIEVTVSKEQLLPGVYAALLGMRSGGSVRRVTLEPAEAYSQHGWKTVPPNSSLVVELCPIKLRPSQRDKD